MCRYYPEPGTYRYRYRYFRTDYSDCTFSTEDPAVCCLGRYLYPYMLGLIPNLPLGWEKYTHSQQYNHIHLHGKVSCD